MIKHTYIIRYCAILPLLLLLLSEQNIYAQRIKLSIPDDFPYELKAEQEMGLMLTGTGLLYGSVIGQMNKEAWGRTPISRLDPQDLFFIDRSAVNNWNPGLNDMREFFEPALSLGVLSSIGAYGLISKRQKKSWSELMTLTFMYFEGLYISTGVELLTKSLVNRTRPFTYNTDLPIEQRIRSGNNESFFSGNATLLFYNASFLSLITYKLYPDARWTPYIIGGTFAIAELSAWWSVRSGMHFPSDVLTGAVWGSAVALFINQTHKIGARGFNIMPWMIREGKGLIIRYKIQDSRFKN